MERVLDSSQTEVTEDYEYALRQRALDVMKDENGVIHGSSDDIQKMMLQLEAQEHSEAEYGSESIQAIS